MPGLRKGNFQITFVQYDQGFDVLGLGGNQGPRKLRFRKLWLSCQQDENLIEIGGKRFGANFVTPVKKILSFQHTFNRTFVGSRLPPNAIAHHRLAFLSPRMTKDAHAIVQLNHTMSAMGGHYQTGVHGFLCGSHQSLSSLGFGMCALVKLAHAACELNANWRVDVSNKTSHTKDRA